MRISDWSSDVCSSDLQKVRLTPYNLVKLSPAVTHPGIHLGVWHEDNDLYIWGSTHVIPELCFVLEVVDPGLLVVKHKQTSGFGKFANVAILNADQIKVIDRNSQATGPCTSLLNSDRTSTRLNSSH